MSLTGMAYSESAPAKPVKPKMVKQYMLGSLLGEGSYGKVREAIDSNTLRRVAVKIVDKRRLYKVRGAEEQQKREIAMQRKLSHRGVVGVIEQISLEEKPDKLYYVFELVTGGSLQALLESYPEGRLPLCLCHRLFGQLLDALEHCHAKGVIHRDIKPANLMITADGQLKLSDFGSAELIGTYHSEDTLTKSSGSPAFHSPEVANGSTLFSGTKVDVWAAGVTLYLLATGSVPFAGNSLIHLYETIAKGEYSIPDCISSQPLLVDLLSKLLAVDQDARLTVGDARQHPWLTEPDPAWEAEAASAVREIAERIRRQKSTVLPYIAKQYEQEEGAAAGTSADGAAAGDGAGPPPDGGMGAVIAPACAGVSVSGASGRIAAGLGQASELLARGMLKARTSTLSSLSDPSGTEASDADLPPPPPAGGASVTSAAGASGTPAASALPPSGAPHVGRVASAGEVLQALTGGAPSAPGTAALPAGSERAGRSSEPRADAHGAAPANDSRGRRASAPARGDATGGIPDRAAAGGDGGECALQ